QGDTEVHKWRDLAEFEDRRDAVIERCQGEDADNQAEQAEPHNRTCAPGSEHSAGPDEAKECAHDAGEDEEGDGLAPDADVVADVEWKGNEDALSGHGFDSKHGDGVAGEGFVAEEARDGAEAEGIACGLELFSCDVLQAKREGGREDGEAEE